MSGELENKSDNYLSYFGLDIESSVEKKAKIFSKEVLDISFDISNELMNKPNYKYGDIEKVNYLTKLRNDILECDKKALKPFLNMRFDYICINCKKENGNMFRERYSGSYYSSIGNVIEDLVPYLLPQQKEEAIRDISTIKKEDLQRFVELFIAVYHGDYVGGINAIKVECNNSNYEALKNNGAGLYRYLGNGFPAHMTRYNINGSSYYERFSEIILPGFKILDDEKKVLESLDKRRYELIAELLMNSVTSSSKDCTALITVTNMDFYFSSQENPSEIDFKSLGAISIELSKRFGIDIDIRIHIPDNINDYQEKILIALKEEFKKWIIKNNQEKVKKRKTKKRNTKKRKQNLGFLDANADYSGTVEPLIVTSPVQEQEEMPLDFSRSSISIANMRMAIRTIDMCLIKHTIERKKIRK